MNTQKNPVPKPQILPYLAPRVRTAAERLPESVWNNLEEIRLGVQRPAALYTSNGSWFLSESGQPVVSPDDAVICSKKEIDDTLQLASQNSIYAVSDKLKCGYITISGGHRVGVTGTVVISDGSVSHIRDVSSLNIRIAHAVFGSANRVLPDIIQGKTIHNTMIIGPPQSGKTTLLRDIARQIGSGSAAVKVGLIDERGEIAAMCNGAAQQDVGIRTDVLDFCPKAVGMPLLVRSMSPDVIITDEIGLDADAYALMQVLGCGVQVITTAHGRNLEDVMQRPFFKSCMRHFDCVIELSRRMGTGTIERILRRDCHDF